MPACEARCITVCVIVSSIINSRAREAGESIKPGALAPGRSQQNDVRSPWERAAAVPIKNPER